MSLGDELKNAAAGTVDVPEVESKRDRTAPLNDGLSVEVQEAIGNIRRDVAKALNASNTVGMEFDQFEARTAAKLKRHSQELTEISESLSRLARLNDTNSGLHAKLAEQVEMISRQIDDTAGRVEIIESKMEAVSTALNTLDKRTILLKNQRLTLTHIIGIGIAIALVFNGLAQFRGGNLSHRLNTIEEVMNIKALP